MAAHPGYAGLLVIDGRWAQAILAKHLAFGGMVLIAAVQTWILLPRLAHHRLREATGSASDAESIAHTRQGLDRLTRVNAVLALLVLALTAIARTA
jgi:putative copper export protein